MDLANQVNNQIIAQGTKEFATAASHIPCFFNDSTLDTISAKLFIEKIEDNIRSGYLTQETAFIRIPTVLKGEAKRWYDSVKFVGRSHAPTNWQQFKTIFCKDFDVILTNAAATKTLGKLSQGKNQSVVNFYSDCVAAIEQIHMNIPQPTREGITDRVHAAAPVNAAENAERQAEKDHFEAMSLILIQNAYMTVAQFYIKNHFVNGLLPEIHDEVAAKPDLSCRETFDYAKRLASIKMAKQKVTIAAVATPDTQEGVSAAQQRPTGSQRSGNSDNKNWRNNSSGSGNPHKNQNYNSKSSGSANSTQTKTTNAFKNVTCWFCKKLGHIQTQCRSRINDNKPLRKSNFKVFLIDGSPVVPEDGMTPDEQAICKTYGIQGFCESEQQDFQKRE